MNLCKYTHRKRRFDLSPTYLKFLLSLTSYLSRVILLKVVNIVHLDLSTYVSAYSLDWLKQNFSKIVSTYFVRGKN